MIIMQHNNKILCGIYSITNLTNDKIYIGQSVNILARWKNHLTELYGGYHHNDHLQKSFDKYGEDNFDFKIIKACKPRYLDRFEKLYIRIFDTLNQEKGYNKIAGGNENKKYSSESKENISKGLTEVTKQYILISNLYPSSNNKGFVRYFWTKKVSFKGTSEILSIRKIPFPRLFPTGFTIQILYSSVSLIL